VFALLIVVSYIFYLSYSCQGVLRDQHGMKWREKIPEGLVFSTSDIPEIIDSTGQPVQSKVTPVLPSNTPVTKETVVKEEQAATKSQDTAKTSSTTTTAQKTRETTATTPPSPVKLTTEEKFDQAKAEGNKHVQEVCCLLEFDLNVVICFSYS